MSSLRKMDHRIKGKSCKRNFRQFNFKMKSGTPPLGAAYLPAVDVLHSLFAQEEINIVIILKHLHEVWRCKKGTVSASFGEPIQKEIQIQRKWQKNVILPQD